MFSLLSTLSTDNYCILHFHGIFAYVPIPISFWWSSTVICEEDEPISIRRYFLGQDYLIFGEIGQFHLMIYAILRWL